MMEWHPEALEYPLMPEAELAAMVADMKANGYDPKFPILRVRGKGIDGRNREIAAEKAGVAPCYLDLPDDTDLKATVERYNDHRRHETPEVREQRQQQRSARVAAARRE